MNKLLEVSNGSVDILRKNSPKLLLGAGIALGIGAVTASGIASFKASEVIRDIQCDPRFDDKKKAYGEYLKRVVPLYIPVAILETGSVVCLVKSYDTLAKRLAVATGLAEMSIETFKLYKERTKKLLGEERVKEIEEEVKKEQEDKDAKNVESGIDILNSDVQWFVDSLTNQEFLSTINNVTRANLKFMERMSFELQMSKNDWLDILSDYTYSCRNGKYQRLTVPDGDDIGWIHGESLEVYMDKMTHTNSGHVAVLLTYSSEPRVGFRERYSEYHHMY